MTRLTQRVRRLESRSGTTAPRPWELAGWERLSEVDQLREIERYVAAYPDQPACPPVARDDRTLRRRA